MARRGRPGKGLGHVDALEGAPATKDRLKWILRTLDGSCSLGEAAAALGLSEARLRVLRAQALGGALGALSPGVPGRPAHAAEDPEIVRLREENAMLLFELQAACARTEVALALPHLLRERPPTEPGEKRGPAPRGRRPRWFAEASPDTDGGSNA